MHAYGYNVGIYSDGGSILTALREGLKDKTQNSFEKVYQLDKMYEEAGRILALGRFWFVLPWPLNDKKLSMKYLREYQQTPYFSRKPEGPIYLAELLISLGGKENKAEAKSILESRVNTEEAFFFAGATGCWPKSPSKTRPGLIRGQTRKLRGLPTVWTIVSLGKRFAGHLAGKLGSKNRPRTRKPTGGSATA